MDQHIRSTTVAATLRPGLTIITLFEYSVSTQVTRHLQMVLNAAAHLVVGAGKFDQYDHITPVLHDVLH